jgi:hypothetical protein
MRCSFYSTLMLIFVSRQKIKAPYVHDLNHRTRSSLCVHCDTRRSASPVTTLLLRIPPLICTPVDPGSDICAVQSASSRRFLCFRLASWISQAHKFRCHDETARSQRPYTVQHLFLAGIERMSWRISPQRISLSDAQQASWKCDCRKVLSDGRGWHDCTGMQYKNRKETNYRQLDLGGSLSGSGYKSRLQVIPNHMIREWPWVVIDIFDPGPTQCREIKKSQSENDASSLHWVTITATTFLVNLVVQFVNERKRRNAGSEWRP